MLTKKDAKMAQGLAIFGMIMLHLFCRIDNLPYNVYIYIGNKPLIYYIGLFGDFCVPIYCFCSGYAQQIMYESDGKITNGIKRLPKFLFHFWLIVILFSIIGIACNSPDIPRNLKNFIGNILLYRLSYNGAWWFVLTYIWLILLYPGIRKIIDKINNPMMVIILSGIFYVISYYFEVIHILNIQNVIVAWLWRQFYLLGRSQFAFIVGIISCKYLLIDKISEFCNEMKLKNVYLCILVILAFVMHCFIQSMFIAPITGMIVLVVFHLIEKPKWVKRIFLLLGKHSTNIWLIHMFFYLVLFKNLIFKLKEPILILVGMFMICIGFSILINKIEKIIFNLLGVMVNEKENFICH